MRKSGKVSETAFETFKLKDKLVEATEKISETADASKLVHNKVK